MTRALRCIAAIAWREIWSMLVTPATWFVVALFVLISSFVFYLVPLEHRVATFTPMVDLVKFMGIFFSPLITMRLFAEEKRNGTLETLMTTSVRPVEIVLAKAFSGMMFYCLVLSPCAVYVLLLDQVGNVDGGVVVAQAWGLLLLGLVYVTGGLLVSALCASQIAAAAGSVVLLLTLWILHDLGGTGPIGALLRGLSIKPHFDDAFARGMLDSADTVYFLSLAAFFLTGTWLAVRSAAQPAPAAAGMRHSAFATALMGAGATEAALFGLARLDLSETPWAAATWGDKALLAAPFVVTLALLLLLAIRLRTGWGHGGSGRRLGATALGLASVAAILVNVNIIAARPANRVRVDISEVGMNTLDPRTRETLDRLEADCVLTVFYTMLDKYEGFDLVGRTRELLREYAAHTPRLRMEFIDPAREPLRALEKARLWKIDPSRLDRMAMAEYGAQRAVIPLELVLRKKPSLTGGPAEIVFSGEEAFTSAIRRVRDPRMPRVRIAQGHGEFQPFLMDGGARAMGEFVQSLRLDGMRVESLVLRLEDSAIPADCEVLVIAGAIIPFTPAQIAGFRGYVERGGRLLILLDPPVTDEEPTGLEDLLAGWGIGINNDHAFDTQHTLANDAGTILALGSDRHPVTASGRAVTCYLQGARSLRILGSAAEGWTARQVLMSTRTAGTQRMIRGPQTARLAPGTEGPFALAASAEHAGGGRVLVVGDADLAGNFGLKLGHNRAFLASVMEWLIGREHTIRIPEREDHDRSLAMTAADRRLIWWVALIALPQAWALAGLVVWWLRRQ